MDNSLKATFFAGMVALAALGVMFLAGDFRHFSNIERHCKERGYIQNTKTRINCSVEVGK
jgi:hypothetical protein